MINLFPTIGSGAAKVQGNGPVYANGEQLFAQPHIADLPLFYENQDGLSAPPILRTIPGVHQIGWLVGASGNTTADQRMDIVGAAEHIPLSMTFCHATRAPVEMTGGVYTEPNKQGVQIISAAQIYTGLSGAAEGVLEIELTPALRSFAFLFLSLTTPNAEPVTFDMLLLARVTKLPGTRPYGPLPPV